LSVLVCTGATTSAVPTVSVRSSTTQGEPSSSSGSLVPSAATYPLPALRLQSRCRGVDIVRHWRTSVTASRRGTGSGSWGGKGSPMLSKPHTAASIAAVAILLFSAFYSPLQSQTLVTLLVWASVSLLVAPFAPSYITAAGSGSVVEGRGREAEEAESWSKARRLEEPAPSVGSVLPTEKKREQRNGVAVNAGDGAEKGELEEREWNDEDFEILKKQIAKHLVGMPMR
ncbi:hypothetical protein Taro_005025, partial [Colocasia esculenta]|nr:hypothetical protein [Colocasia esculenta]